MKNLKCFLALFMLLSTALTSYAQYYEEEDEKIDCSYYGIFYTAPFEAADYGVIGFGGEFYGEKFGGRFAVGWSDVFNGFDNGGAYFELGPSYHIPLSKNIGITTPLCLVVSCTTSSEGGDDWNFGASFIPKFIFKTGKFSVNLGAGGLYAGEDISPVFTAGIAYDF